jgi:dihydropteroate synthase
MRSARELLESGTSDAPLVMAILNVTPDSFSDGGVHFDRVTAIDSALRMERDGAAIVDIGAVPVQEELERVIPVIEGIRACSAVRISIDTRKARVAAAALDAGADLVNDVSGMRHDPGMRTLVARRRVPAILMHMRGVPATMQEHAKYEDVVSDVVRELEEACGESVAAGVSREQLLFDPGIGFAKTFEHNLELLARCRVLTRLGPVVIGGSRKAFVGHLTGRPNGAERMAGSLAAVAAAVEGGAAIVRVHDVKETVDFLKVMRAVRVWR